MTRELDPAPIYDEPRGLFNTEIVAAQDLLNPANNNYGEDFYLSQDLARYLRWRHDPPLISNSKANRNMAARIEAALACRYLVVTRRGLATDFEAFLFDLESTELLLRLTISGVGPDEGATELMRELRKATNGTFVSD